MVQLMMRIQQGEEEGAGPRSADSGDEEEMN